MAPSSGGRPPILLKLEPKAGYVVGVKLRGDGLTTVVCDLDGQVVKTAETSVALVGQPAAAIKEIAQATRKALSDASIPRSKVLAIGVGVSGIIDSQTGVCRFSHLLGWRDVEIAAPLRQKLRVPVWVDNDVNTLAVAEKWAGGGIEARNFVTLSIGRGIGIGIVIDRSLYRGTALVALASSATSCSTRMGRSASAESSAAWRHSSASGRSCDASVNASATTSHARSS